MFNLLTGLDMEVAAFSTGKVEANHGIAKIPDERIDFLVICIGLRKPPMLPLR